MSVANLINRPAVLIRRSEEEVDEYASERPDEDSEEIVCELQQRARTEPSDGGELSDTDWVAYFFPETAPHGNDVLLVDGQRFEFVGEPWLVRNPRTREESHIEASLRRTAGPGAGS